MKKNVQAFRSHRTDLKNAGQPSMTGPLVISTILHAVFLALFVFTPSLNVNPPRARSVINVSMVSLNSTDSPAAAKTPSTQKETTPTPPEPKPPAPAKTETPPVAVPVKKPAAVETPPQPKTSLKKKTFQSTRVVKQALQQLQEKVAATPKPSPSSQDASPEDLKSALDRLRQEVNKTEAGRTTTTATGTGRETGATGGAHGKLNEAGGRKAELIDLYRIEIAFEIKKHWVFNEQLAGGDPSLVSAIVFKVMPDGEIRDIFFTDRSGNTYLDESGYKAIVKSNPVDPHPPGLNLPYVQMGVKFTPQGIR